MIQLALDWRRINKAVAEAYEKFNPHTVPFNLFEMLDKLDNVTVMTYQQMADLFANGEIEKMKRKFSTNSQDAFLYRLAQSGEKFYYLVYNPNISFMARIRFSIAHELGHYFMKHFEDSDTVLSRGGIEKEKYRQFEAESDSFASAFLINPIFLMGTETADEIARKFDVSYSAANNAAQRYKKYPYVVSYWKQSLVYDGPIHFIYRKNYSDYRPTYYLAPGFLSLMSPSFVFCYDCHALNSTRRQDDVNYCSVCGSKNVHITYYTFEFHETEAQEVIEYPKYKVSGTPSKLVNECIRCHNKIDDNTGDFCEVCGTYLINRCSGVSHSSINWSTDSGYPEIEMYNPFDDGFDTVEVSSKYVGSNNLVGCDYPQSGKARFCGACGSVTSYALQHLFPSFVNEPLYKDLKSRSGNLPQVK